MDSNDVFNASLMLNFLKKEENFYKIALQSMEQEYIKLQIEELALKAAVRQETINAEKEQRKERELKASDSAGTKIFTPVSNQQKQNVNKVRSNINDDRYLEPLILNPRGFDENALIEFDD